MVRTWRLFHPTSCQFRVHERDSLPGRKGLFQSRKGGGESHLVFSIIREFFQMNNLFSFTFCY